MKSISLQFDSSDCKKLAIGNTVLMQHFRVIVNEFAPDMVSEAEHELNQMAANYSSLIIKHLNTKIPEIQVRLEELQKQYQHEKRMKAAEKYEVEVKNLNRGRSFSDSIPINISQKVLTVDDSFEEDESTMVSNEKVVVVVELLKGLKDVLKTSFERYKLKLKTVLKLNSIQKYTLGEIPVPNVDDDVDFIIKLINKI